jgi:photosystem II stability/assembly factor-like uncharacterized protein
VRLRSLIGLAMAALALGLPAGGALTPAPSLASSIQPGGLAGIAVQGLAVDRSGPGIVYAATAGGEPGNRPRLYKTVDGGRSWVRLERGLPPGFQPTTLAVSPDGGREVVVAGVDGLFRSVAAGASWQPVRVPLPPITALLFDRSDPRRVLAGTELRGNYQSTDGGRTWRPASLGLPRDRYGNVPGAVQFVQHPADPRTLFMATYGFAGVYRSTDGGLSWQAMGEGLPSSLVRDLAMHPAAPDSLYALTDAGLARWTAGAGTWTGVRLPVADPVAIELEPDNRDTIYVAGAQGALYRSTNGGAGWVELASLPRPVRDLATWTTTSGSLLGAAAGEGVWLLKLRPTLPASPLPPGPNRQYFPETGHNVSPTFFPFFRAMGGVERFGYPRTEEMMEDGLLVQYFQRARLEHRPDRRGTPYEVQISLIGEWLLGPERPPRAEPFESNAEQRYFEETGHSVNFAFLRYFNTRGGLDSLGYPVTEELQEDGRPVQYFQRAKLEYRPEFKGTRDEVQLGLIGDELLRRRDWLD